MNPGPQKGDWVVRIKCKDGLSRYEKGKITDLRGDALRIKLDDGLYLDSASRFWDGQWRHNDRHAYGLRLTDCVACNSDMVHAFEKLILWAKNLELHLIVGSVVHCGQLPCPSSGCRNSLPKFKESLARAEAVIRSIHM